MLWQKWNRSIQIFFESIETVDLWEAAAGFTGCPCQTQLRMFGPKKQGPSTILSGHPKPYWFRDIFITSRCLGLRGSPYAQSTRIHQAICSSEALEDLRRGPHATGHAGKHRMPRRTMVWIIVHQWWNFMVEWWSWFFLDPETCSLQPWYLPTLKLWNGCRFPYVYAGIYIYKCMRRPDSARPAPGGSFDNRK